MLPASDIRDLRSPQLIAGPTRVGFQHVSTHYLRPFRTAAAPIVPARAHRGACRVELRRDKLACEVVHAEIGAIEAQFFGGYRQLDRLQKRIRRSAYVKVRRCVQCPKERKPIFFGNVPQREGHTSQ